MREMEGTGSCFKRETRTASGESEDPADVHGLELFVSFLFLWFNVIKPYLRGTR